MEQISAIDAVLLQRIEEDLAQWDNGSRIQALAADARKKYEALAQPLMDAIEQAERFTAEDFGTVVSMEDQKI